MDDLRIARLCSIIAETNRDGKKRKKPFTEKDFMFEFGNKNEGQKNSIQAKRANSKRLKNKMMALAQILPITIKKQ